MDAQAEQKDPNIEWIDTGSYRILKPVFPMQLPCGYVGPSGKLLREFELYRTSGFEEDILTDESLKQYDGMNTVLTRCLARLGDCSFKRAEERSSAETAEVKAFVQGLLINDRAFMLHVLRWISARDGAIYRFRYICPVKSCRHDFVVSLDFRTLLVTEMATPTVREYRLNLQDAGKTVTFRHLRVRDEENLIKLVETHGASSVSAALWLQIVDVDGVRVSNHMDLRQWSSADRDDLRAEIESTSGGIDMWDLITCPECKSTQRAPRQLDAGFFFPSHVGSARRQRT